MILRWKKTTRALRINEQEYGRHLTDVLERVTDAQLVHFRDPVEAALFFCLLDLLNRTREVNAVPAGEIGKDPARPAVPAGCGPG